MIEDDLRSLLADEVDVDVYARFIPITLPECVTVAIIGGRNSTAGIRRTYHSISVMACSSDKETAEVRLREARDILTTGLPADINGTHYYTAVPLADGSMMKKTVNGPRYIEFVDMEVACSI